MMASQRFVQLAQADAAPSSTLFPTSNHRRNVPYAHRLAFAGAVDAAGSARMEQSFGHARRENRSHCKTC